MVPLFPRQNYSSFFQPRSQPRERVSFLFELRHFLFDRTLNGKMSSVADASRFSFSLHESKKKQKHCHGYTCLSRFFSNNSCKMSTLSRSFRFSCLSEAEQACFQVSVRRTFTFFMQKVTVFVTDEASGKSGETSN